MTYYYGSLEQRGYNNHQSVPRRLVAGHTPQQVTYPPSQNVFTQPLFNNEHLIDNSFDFELPEYFENNDSGNDQLPESPDSTSLSYTHEPSQATYHDPNLAMSVSEGWLNLSQNGNDMQSSILNSRMGSMINDASGLHESAQGLSVNSNATPRSSWQLVPHQDQTHQIGRILHVTPPPYIDSFATASPRHDPWTSVGPHRSPEDRRPSAFESVEATSDISGASPLPMLPAVEVSGCFTPQSSPGGSSMVRHSSVGSHPESSGRAFSGSASPRDPPFLDNMAHTFADFNNNEVNIPIHHNTSSHSATMHNAFSPAAYDNSSQSSGSPTQRYVFVENDKHPQPQVQASQVHANKRKHMTDDDSGKFLTSRYTVIGQQSSGLQTTLNLPHVREEGTSKPGPAGGRRKGTHLLPEKAEKTKLMRKEGSCWTCCFQRDECTPGDKCDRCSKKNYRGVPSDHQFGCNRTRLFELIEYFMPELMVGIHDEKVLRQFGDKHIRRWTGNHVQLALVPGQGLPPLTCETYEFHPSTGELLRQFQYKNNPDTGECTREIKKSPPLGMQQLNAHNLRQYETYIDTIADKYPDQFIELFYGEEDNDFSERLLKLISNLRFKLTEADDKKLFRSIMRVIVVTYIMGHTLTIPEDQKEDVLSSLDTYQRGSYAKFCSPRMANRQLKYLFSHLHKRMMNDLLKQLQQVLKNSSTRRWTSAFCAILGLGMALEDSQKTIHIIMDSKAAQGELQQREADYLAEVANVSIDGQFHFITELFRLKYKGINPFHTDETKKLGANAMMFLKDVKGLFHEKENYLYNRQYVRIETAVQGKYTSRLVARFMFGQGIPASVYGVS
ncbi:hypothetical protein M501DRAFT_993562 [Patellaria atrata CBS 101060]|uniref:Uncharacterized protein n=1 Tax=Patellaria atrata CBS 101060 TaxID=1346257 RepID=A0A9P4SH34_9PEZI|nr:hypothetical protein M501DRAFT_993562 [Patellaria atrata CBS 101060]